MISKPNESENLIYCLMHYIRKLTNNTSHRFYFEKCLQSRNAYYETRLPRVLCCLGRALSRLGEHEEAKRCLDEARDMFRQLIPDNAPGVDFTETDELVKYDQIVNLWSGRLTGKLNLECQTHPKPLASGPDLKEMLN